MEILLKQKNIQDIGHGNINIMMENSFIRSFVLVICTFALSIPSLAQDDNVEQGKVFDVVEQMPQFPGGEAELYQYIQTHIQYPPEYGDVYIQGRVVVQFVVEKDGSIGEVKVVRSLDKDLDAEAVRLVKSLPKFTPARQNGQVVRCWYTLPVTFKLRASVSE